MTVFLMSRGKQREFIFDDVEEIHISTDKGTGLQIQQSDPKEYGWGWLVEEAEDDAEK